MPTYEYQCLACGEKFEFVENINSNPKKKCPKCKRKKLQRLISRGVGVIFKGSGFTRSKQYNIDRRNDMEREVSEKDCSGLTHGWDERRKRK